MKNFLFVALIGIVLLGACADGNCRVNREKDAAANPGKYPPRDLSSDIEKVKVFKYDGSQQCGLGKAISADEMRKEFGAIKVYAAENKMDKLMHSMRCGADSGRANVFDIAKKDLAEAKKLGFREWLWE